MTDARAGRVLHKCFQKEQKLSFARLFSS
jgi:hypothetical protein